LVRYDNETRFKNSNERILANFSSNKEKEKFLSKINFLVCVSKYNLPLMVEVEQLKEEFPVQLREIMNKILYEESIMGEILNEANIDCVYKYSLNKVQNIWIEEYINKFYGGEEIIMDKSTDDNVAYFVGDFEWDDDDLDGVNSTNNVKLDSERNLSEVSEIIQGKLNKYVKGDEISDLTSILEQIELDKLGGKETYTLISILKEMGLGNLEWKEIYNLISILKEMELGKLEWDEIYTLTPLLKEIERGKLIGKGIYNLTYIQEETELDEDNINKGNLKEGDIKYANIVELVEDQVFTQLNVDGFNIIDSDYAFSSE
ncbi:hypothetical protein QA658_12830, partial [Proteus mirabilis]|nr:hypothetical protein [Proteus mirabilis]